MLDTSVFVDDLFFGAATVAEAFKLSSEASHILRDAGMNLRKFETNSEELRIKWVEENLVINENDFPDKSLKVLGLTWNNKDDSLGLELSSLLQNLNVSSTKRNVLRTVSKIFDPSGFAAPFVIRIKCLLQNLWIQGISWDENFSGELEREWQNWLSEIENLLLLKIPRYYFCPLVIMERGHIELHIFTDANPNAYGAVAYLRYEIDKEKFKTCFVMAKSRVAPLKKLTLPRLELMGALIGARVAKYLKNILEISSVVFWSDSEIVLHWIKGSSKKWKPFICNRISEIHETSDPKSWRHCEGKSNPADLITRGCSSKQLLSSEIWWKGPNFLSLPEKQWPNIKISSTKLPDVSEEQSRKNAAILSAVIQTNKSDQFRNLNLSKYSSLKKLYRVTAWMFRFIFNAKKEKENRNFFELSADEIFHAENFWLKEIQEECFPKEIEALKTNKNIPHDSILFKLNPVLSDNGLLLVRGRLQQANLNNLIKHPIVLPSKHKLSDLIIKDAHERVLHAGVSDTLVEIREKFWLLKGKQTVKAMLNKCVICKKFQVRPGKQIIAPIPADRINESPPFAVCGLDFAGPLYIKGSDNKYYILLFTCAVTRAIHLELVNNMSTHEFLLAFRRFISRRGLCSVIYSDNAKTFKRAEFELKELWKVMNHPDVKIFYANHGITWKYIIERAAWWGGFYERLVRSVKTSLRKNVGRSSLTQSELETFLVEVEAIINSRPLTFIYSELEEPSALTPAHLLIGKRILGLPTIRLNDFKIGKDNLVKRFRLRETQLNHFWNRWRKEYVLQLRSVHVTDQRKSSEFQKNDIVLIHDEHLPRTFWKLGKVTKTFLGRDGKVRACEVKANNFILRRPVQLLYNLEVNDFKNSP